MKDKQHNTDPMSEAMYYVLLALKNPNYGYLLIDVIKEISNGNVLMGPGTLYGILTRLKQEKMISEISNDGRRKIYQLTVYGLESLKNEYYRLERMINDLKKMEEINEKNNKNKKY